MTKQFLCGMTLRNEGSLKTRRDLQPISQSLKVRTDIAIRDELAGFSHSSFTRLLLSFLMNLLRRYSAKPGIVQAFSRHVGPSYICSACRQVTTQPLHRPPRIVPLLGPRLRRDFSSNAPNLQKHGATEPPTEKDASSSGNQSQRRKLARSPAANSSLRRVAVEAQRTRSGILSRTQLLEQGLGELRVWLAVYCACTRC